MPENKFKKAINIKFYCLIFQLNLYIQVFNQPGIDIMNEKKALIIIDMQYYFLSTTTRRFTTQLIPAIQNLLVRVRQLQIPVIHIKTVYEHDKSNWPQAWLHREKLYCMRDSHDAEILQEISPVPGEIVISKSRYSAFFNTLLKSRLEEKNIKSIVLAGYSSDCCVRFTAIDAQYWYKNNHFK